MERASDMTEWARRIKNQRRISYLLFATVPLVFLVGVAIVFISDFAPLTFLAFLPTLVQLLVAYWLFTSSKDQKPVTDERTDQIRDRAGHMAFWGVLLYLMIYDELLARFVLNVDMSGEFQISMVSKIGMIFGIIIYAGIFVYYSYIK